jgi:hypothetical protein
MWTLAPGALSTSAVGVLLDKPFAPGWAFIGQLETSFDPYSLELSNSPYAIGGNRGVPLNQQTAYSDSSRAGQFYNSVGYVGINSDTFGTITFFRVNALTLDAITAYDPMGGSYAFSALGFSSSNCGAGDSETCRITTAIKYRVNIGPIRLAALRDLQMGERCGEPLACGESYERKRSSHCAVSPANADSNDLKQPERDAGFKVSRRAASSIRGLPMVPVGAAQRSREYRDWFYEHWRPSDGKRVWQYDSRHERGLFSRMCGGHYLPR